MLQRRPSQPPFVYEFIHVSQLGSTRSIPGKYYASNVVHSLDLDLAKIRGNGWYITHDICMTYFSSIRTVIAHSELKLDKKNKSFL